MALIVQDKARNGYDWERASRVRVWLIQNIRLYLTGFLKCGFLPETCRNARIWDTNSREFQAFTIVALSMIGAYAKVIVS
jgi:hypothetical protein